MYTSSSSCASTLMEPCTYTAFYQCTCRRRPLSRPTHYRKTSFIFSFCLWCIFLFGVKSWSRGCSLYLQRLKVKHLCVVTSGWACRGSGAMSVCVSWSSCWRSTSMWAEITWVRGQKNDDLTVSTLQLSQTSDVSVKRFPFFLLSFKIRKIFL